MTDDILQAIRHRDALKKQLLHNQHNLALFNRYRAYRNRVTYKIKITKNNYYKLEIDKNKGQTKKVWNLLKEASNDLGNKKVGSLVIKEENGEIITDCQDIADEFNNFFCRVGPTLASKIKHPNRHFSDAKNNVSMFLSPVDKTEVNKYINNLKNTTSVGKDEITTKIIKMCHEFLNKPLVHIINTIFVTGVTPDHFKESIVIPIFKSGKTSDKSNYRPISLVNNFTKIFEKALNFRLQNFLNKHNIISDNQYGFRPKMSTCDAVYRLTSIINDSLHSNKKCITVFLDLAKAFDTVPHLGLLQKLENIGIRGRVLDVFASYLQNRTQFVRVGGCYSSQHTLTTGIPQGTVIAPILFIIYINSLNHLNISGQIISYADDTAVVFSSNTWEDVLAKVKSDMNHIKDWLSFNLLSLNILKTKFMTFSIYNSSQPNINEIHLGNDNIITAVDVIKYLGVHIDKNLKWQDHVLYITNKIRRLFHKFYIFRDILSRNLLLQVYQTLIEAIIRYGILVWGGAYMNCLRPLVTVQKTALKIILRKTPMCPGRQLFMESGLLNVKQIYVVEAIMFVKRNIDKYEPVSHNNVTRMMSNANVAIQFFSKTQQQNFVDYLGPFYYNLMPAEIKCLSGRQKFKHEITKYIIQNNIG